MNRILLIDTAIVLGICLTISPLSEKSQGVEAVSREFQPWEIYYGEVNQSHAWVQVDTNFYYYNSEFLMIGPQQKGYAIIDTCSLWKVDSLVPALLKVIRHHPDNNDERMKIEKIPIDSHSFIIRFLSPKKADKIYKMCSNGEAYISTEWYLSPKQDTVPVMWTGRNRFTTKEKIFKKYLLP